MIFVMFKYPLYPQYMTKHHAENANVRVLALPVSEIGQIFRTLLGFSLQPHVKMLPIDPYFSFDILKI